MSPPLPYPPMSTKRVVIYDFMPNRSLEKFIYDKHSSINRLLGWEKLYHIETGIASRARVLTTRSFGGVSHKSDVYSYGMMVLEMVGGWKNVDAATDHTSKIYFSDQLTNLYVTVKEKIEKALGQSARIGFLSVKKLNKGDRNVLVRNGEKAQVEAVGTLRLVLESDFNLDLVDTVYVPNAEYNRSCTLRVINLEEIQDHVSIPVIQKVGAPLPHKEDNNAPEVVPNDVPPITDPALIPVIEQPLRRSRRERWTAISDDYIVYLDERLEYCYILVTLLPPRLKKKIYKSIPSSRIEKNSEDQY
ncbi:hypothetical protein RJ639_008402 [Escallonia herrerae]|uniref:Protein kinase domain-containing protein n=1 Tax=Escallonia herrerae TaxID=1293975 RepID=A0AA89AQD2_9ASTE|nr:hypothetical protein RJ639_008402 [Escallonia herrerae]